MTADSSTIAGLDALELAVRATPRRTRAHRAWAATWPKLAALALVLAAWQVVVLSGWRPEYVLPAPATVGRELLREASTAHLWQEIATTMRRAVVGFALAAAVGGSLGALVSRIRWLRAAIGSLITALQTMPSIAWFPLAILLYQLTESAIMFVIVLGAAPSIANGVTAGVDYAPPLLIRAGRNLGARGLSLYRHVIGPASLPSVVAGLKQGWAFAWRSLMAGELMVAIAYRPSVGVTLQQAREQLDAPMLLATMVVILVLGLVVDACFGAADRAIRARWGLIET